MAARKSQKVLKTIGNIGFGEFAQLMARELAPCFEIVVSSRSEHPENQLLCRFASLDEKLTDY